MSPKYMLDTNICIYLMKRQPAQAAQRFAQGFVGDIVISAITLAELEYGAACSGVAREQNREALTAFVEDVPVAPFDIRSAQSYGPIRLATRERNRDALDKLIAAHAVALGTVLVTNNTADFQAYPGLVVENWANNH